MLQEVVALTIVTTTGDGLVDEIPRLDLTATGFHHTLDPLVHRIDECVVHLLLCLRNGLCRLVALELDVLDIDIAHIVGDLQKHETGLQDRCDVN